MSVASQSKPADSTDDGLSASAWEKIYDPRSEQLSLPGPAGQNLSARITAFTTETGLTLEIMPMLRQHSSGQLVPADSFAEPSRTHLSLESATIEPVRPRGYPGSTELVLKWEGLARASLRLTDEQRSALRGTTAPYRAAWVQRVFASGNVLGRTQITLGQHTYDKCHRILQGAHDEIVDSFTSGGSFGREHGSRVPFSWDDWQAIGQQSTNPVNAHQYTHLAACLRGIYVRSGQLRADEELSTVQVTNIAQKFWSAARPSTMRAVPLDTRVTNGLAHSLADLLRLDEDQANVAFQNCREIVGHAVADYESSPHASLQTPEDLLSVLYESHSPQHETALPAPEDEEIYTDDDEEKGVFVNIGNDTGVGSSRVPGRPFGG